MADRRADVQQFARQIERGQGLDLDTAAERIGILVRRGRFGHFERADHPGRQHVQGHRAARRFRRRHQRAVDGHAVVVGIQAAHDDVAAFALVTLDRHAWHARQRLGRVLVRQMADIVAADDADDIVGLLLGSDGARQAGALAGDDHAGRFGGMYANGGQQAGGQGGEGKVAHGENPIGWDAADSGA